MTFATDLAEVTQMVDDAPLPTPVRHCMTCSCGGTDSSKKYQALILAYRQTHHLLDRAWTEDERSQVQALRDRIMVGLGVDPAVVARNA